MMDEQTAQMLGLSWGSLAKKGAKYAQKGLTKGVTERIDKMKEDIKTDIRNEIKAGLIKVALVGIGAAVAGNLIMYAIMRK